MANVQSPIPGVFYRKPAPDKENFVNEGDKVSEGQTIGIVEVMKQFTELHATVDGTLTSFMIANEGMVTPGEVIAIIEED